MRVRRLLVTIVTLLLISVSTATSQAGIMPWLRNFFFGPANAPLFPRFQAARTARFNSFNDCCEPTNAFVNSAPTFAPAYTTSFAPPTVSYAPPVYSNPIVYAPPVSSGYVTDSFVSAPFEYTGAISDCCGCCATGYPIEGTVIDSGSVIESGSVISSPSTSDDGATDIYEAPIQKDDGGESRPAPGGRFNDGGFGEDGSGDSGPGAAGLGGERGRGDRGGFDGFGDERPGGSDAGSSSEPWEDPIKRGGDGGGDGLFGTNKPVAAEAAEDVPPPAKAPVGPSAKNSSPRVITTVSLTGELSRDKYRPRARSSVVARSNRGRRMLRWISVPNDGRTARR